MNRLSQFISFIVRSFWDIVLNVFANYFGAKLIAFIATVILVGLILLLRILRRPIESIPSYYLLLIAVGGLILGMSIVLLGPTRRRFHWVGQRDVEGFRWLFEYGKVVDGPFCIQCNKPVAPEPCDIDTALELLLKYGDTYMRHSCGAELPNFSNRDQLVSTVESLVDANIRYGTSIEEIPNLNLK